MAKLQQGRTNHADLTFVPPPPDQRPCSHPASGTRLIDGT